MEVGGGRYYRWRCVHKQPKERKSRWQLEILNEAFAEERRPSIEARIELAERTGLLLEKVSMWFATKRFGDRRSPPRRQRLRAGGPALQTPQQSGNGGSGLTSAAISGYGENSVLAPRGSGFGHHRGPPLPSITGPGVGPASGAVGIGITRRLFVAPESSSTLDKGAARKYGIFGQPAQHPKSEPGVVDGPIYGVKFDPLPPGAFGEPIYKEHFTG